MLELLIPPELKSMASPFAYEFSLAEDLVAGVLRDAWKEQAIETRSYRTGAYYRNIHRSHNAEMIGAMRYRDVISDVGYGDIIESIGWGPGNPPRFPAQKAIDAAAPDIEKILDDAAGRVIDRIENG